MFTWIKLLVKFSNTKNPLKRTFVYVLIIIGGHDHKIV